MSSRSSKTSRQADVPESIRRNRQLVIVGRVRRPHGIRGEVMVESMTDADDRFASGSRLAAMIAGETRSRELQVRDARPHSGALRVSFEGIDDRDDAEQLRDAWLVVDRSSVSPLPAGEHYVFDLVGCVCHDHELGEIGEVIDVVEDGGGFLLVLRPQDAGEADAREILVPFVDALLGQVDTASGRIETRLPPGLVELCTSGS